MEEAIKNFSKQFSWEPVIENQDLLSKYRKFVVAGMGGSSLAADLLKIWSPSLDIIVHKDYGLPELPEHDLDHALLIASSFSGNTEETIDALEKATELGISAAVIAAGGRLLEMAKSLGLPYIQIPNDGIQPRMATGYSIKAMLMFLGADEALEEISSLTKKLNVKKAEASGKKLAEQLAGKIPMVYASWNNYSIARNWKIKFNETGKIPSFSNSFPELNHNEMTGFDWSAESKKLSERFHFVFLTDKEDHPRIQKRMKVAADILKKKDLAMEFVELSGGGVWEKMFSSILIADWAAYYIAKANGADPEQVPMVEEFKKLMK